MDKPPSRADDVTQSPAATSPLSSCLRSRNKSRQSLSNRSVSFPEDENRIVTGYLEPVNPWLYGEWCQIVTVVGPSSQPRRSAIYSSSC